MALSVTFVGIAADKGEEPPEKRQRNTEDQDDDERKAVNPNASKMGISKMNGLRSRHGNDKPAEVIHYQCIVILRGLCSCC